MSAFCPRVYWKKCVVRFLHLGCEIFLVANCTCFSESGFSLEGTSLSCHSSAMPMTAAASHTGQPIPEEHFPSLLFRETANNITALQIKEELSKLSHKLTEVEAKLSEIVVRSFSQGGTLPDTNVSVLSSQSANFWCR